MHEFKKYHPIVNFTYFVFTIGFGCFFMHPLCLGISFACGFIYSVMLKGPKAIKTNLTYMLPTLILMALGNTLLNHRGVTIIGYLPGGNPLTLESIIYGFAAGMMILSVICHFSCYNEIMTSDKFIYLFGKIIPSMSLIISMTLRFVPKFAAQLKVVVNAQKCMGRDLSKGSFLKRAKYGLGVLSIMVTWALENAIETADSMKSRGYGIPGRSFFSIFIFGKRDRLMLFLLLLLGGYTFMGYLLGGVEFNYFPMIEWGEISLLSTSVFVSYFLLCVCPIIIEVWEVRKWKVIESKI